MNFLTLRSVFVFLVPAYLIGLFLVYHKEITPTEVQQYFPFLFSFIGLIIVLKSFSERQNVHLSWVLIIMSHFWIALAIAFNEKFQFEHVHFYLSGIAISGIIGLVCLRKLNQLEQRIDLNGFYGYSYKYPKLAFKFLVACLGVSGFPITPTFIGEDLLFSHIHEDQALLAFFIVLNFIMDGLSIIRMYARLSMGPYIKSPYEMAYRSS